MLIDPSKQAATFLRYRDTNYLNCCNPRHMEPEVIRMAVLGSIRYVYVLLFVTVFNNFVSISTVAIIFKLM